MLKLITVLLITMSVYGDGFVKIGGGVDDTRTFREDVNLLNVGLGYNIDETFGIETMYSKGKGFNRVASYVTIRSEGFLTVKAGMGMYSNIWDSDVLVTEVTDKGTVVNVPETDHRDISTMVGADFNIYDGIKAYGNLYFDIDFTRDYNDHRIWDLGIMYEF